MQWKTEGMEHTPWILVATERRHIFLQIGKHYTNSAVDIESIIHAAHIISTG